MHPTLPGTSRATQRIPTPEPSLRPVGILGTGSRLPERVLSNADLEKMVETSDEWIVARTGMKARRIAAEDEATSDLAIAAGRRALENANVDPESIDLVIVGTTTPDHYCCPPTACLVQHELGATNAAALDVTAACTSFMTALTTARSMIACGTIRSALVIGADKLSAVMDYEDRDSCVLFGDGAGAAVLGVSPGRGEILDTVMGSDGSGADLIKVEAGGSRKPATVESVEAREHTVRMHGRKVFKFAVATITDVVKDLVHRNGVKISDIDLFVPHQANLRIIEAAAERLDIQMERVFVNVDRYGNTSSASIPVALDEAVCEGRLKPGNLVCLVAFGGGLTWSGALLRW